METSYILEISKILIPAIISILVVFIARRLEQLRDAELKIREKKIQIYEEFITQSMEFVIKSCKVNEKQRQKLQFDLEKTFEKFHKYLLFWGSDKVIKAYNNYRTSNTEHDGKCAMINYEKFVFALRKDIGHKNKGLKKYDLIKLFLKADEFDENGNLKNI